MRRRPGRARGRHGAVLVQVALLAFAFFALGALLVDLGLVRLSQTRMQAGADLGAIEGLRQRDATGEAARRSDAALLVAWLFDDDMDVTTPDELSQGAGPVVSLGNGIGDANASRRLDVAGSGQYYPELELNLTDEPEGDLVAGTFDAADTLHAEADDYSRTDFAAGPGSDAFLVRLRRTPPSRDPLARVAGVSSSGPTLPLLFGAASTIVGTSQTGGAVRRDGFSVRAVAIARAVPAVLIGRAHDPSGAEGATPFAVTESFWGGLSVGVAADAAVGTDGILIRSDLATELARDLDARGADEGAFAVTGLVPVFRAIGGVRRVVGFGRAEVTRAAAGVVRVTKRASRIAPANASASAADGFPADSAALLQVLSAHAAFVGDPASQAVLAPALVR